MILLTFWLFFLLNHDHSLASSCSSSEDLNEIANWANNLQALKKQDEKKIKQLEQFSADTFMLSEKEIRHKFYEILSQPVQGHCSISKKIGGEWLKSCAWYDGAKFVCLDKLKSAIEMDECLVYSFGLAVDWSFEETMAEMGCTVKTFDPTVNKPKSVTNPRIHFEKVGLAHFKGKTQVCTKQIQYATIILKCTISGH